MNKIPTAEELFEEYHGFKADHSSNDILQLMIEFAKLHVEAALKAAYKNQGWSWTNSTDEEIKLDLFMRNSYPLNNIK